LKSTAEVGLRPQGEQHSLSTKMPVAVLHNHHIPVVEVIVSYTN